MSRLEGMTERLLDLPVKIFADGADLKGIAELSRQPYIHGLTTNPTLMRKVGLTDYESCAKAVLKEVKTKPISYEVFSDDFAERRRQALKIHEWQDNVYVKIPITNTSGESSIPLIERLAGEGVKLNITAMLTLRQVTAVVAVLNSSVPSILSVFAGRIADTGVDPSPIMKESLKIVKALPNAELLWASVREVLNVFQAAA
ncbi:MAG TPA: transaldolase family protein, partial [Candidatus Udaeobacter sp.]|nr:transaldolase family protein [Candidatus Udaeobacter sp.]